MSLAWMTYQMLGQGSQTILHGMSAYSRLKYSWNEPSVLPLILSSIHRSLPIVCSMKLNCLRFCHCVLQKGSMNCL